MNEFEQQLADIAGKPDLKTKVYLWHAEDGGPDFSVVGVLRKGDAVGDDPEDGYEYEIVVGGDSYVTFNASHVESIDEDGLTANDNGIKLR